MKNYISRRDFMVSGLFFIGSCGLTLNGCTLSTKQCLNLSSGEEQLECIYKQLFPAVARGVCWGAVAGAVLGGAVAFATHSPPTMFITVGGIVGGVAGGVVAYYNFNIKRSNHDNNRALSDIYQDVKSERNKFERMNIACLRAVDEIKISIDKKYEISDQKIEKILQISEQTNERYSEVIAVYEKTVELFSEKMSNDTEIPIKIFEQIKTNKLLIEDMTRELISIKNELIRSRTG